jgi:hypothetical protein
MRHNASIRTDLANDLPQIAGDRVQLQQIAMNLIVNSIEAMRTLMGYEIWVSSLSGLQTNKFLFPSVIPVLDFCRSSQNRYSTPSLQLSPTAPAWGFASAAKSLSLCRMVGTCGRRVPWNAAQLFT